MQKKRARLIARVGSSVGRTAGGPWGSLHKHKVGLRICSGTLKLCKFFLYRIIRVMLDSRKIINDLCIRFSNALNIFILTRDLRSSKISPSFSIADAAVWQYALIAFQFNGKFQKQKSFNAPSYNNDSLVSVWQIKVQCVLVSIAKADYFSHVYLAAVKVTVYHDKTVTKAS